MEQVKHTQLYLTITLVQTGGFVCCNLIILNGVLKMIVNHNTTLVTFHVAI